jgi:glyoxylase-like metal-dependent hydrolase (beta-lactamase superfamily II)
MKTVIASLLFTISAVSFAAPLDITPIAASPQGFFVTSTLVSGERDAVLVDASLTQADAHRVVAAILDSKKTLTHVFITHGHPDHHFGLSVLKAAFPNAKLVALSSTVDEITETAKAKVAQWKPMYGANVTDTPVVPEVLTGGTIALEGTALTIVGPVQGDDSRSSYVWVPSQKTLIAGDLVYTGVHVWTADTKPATRKAWLATLEKLAALKPEVVIGGHRAPGAKDDASAIAFTRDYLKAFDEALAASKTPDELFAKVTAKYPAAALDVIAKIGAGAQFAK